MHDTIVISLGGEGGSVKWIIIIITIIINFSDSDKSRFHFPISLMCF